jgi:hypothetical protein
MRTASIILSDQIPVLVLNKPTIEEEVPPQHKTKRFVDPFTSHAYKRATVSLVLAFINQIRYLSRQFPRFIGLFKRPKIFKRINRNTESCKRKSTYLTGINTAISAIQLLTAAKKKQ